MRVRIDELPDKGLRVALNDQLDWAVGAVGQVLEGPVLSLSGELIVRALGSGASVRGQADVIVGRPCDRCLAELRHQLGGEVDLWFDGGRLEGDVDVGLHEDDLDVGFLEDGVLDLGVALGEFFVLESPVRLRCDDASAERAVPGVCVLGGVADEDEPGVDPRFAALKNFRPD